MVTRAIIVAVLALAAPDGASCLATGASKLKKAKGGGGGFGARTVKVAKLDPSGAFSHSPRGGLLPGGAREKVRLGDVLYDGLYPVSLASPQETSTSTAVT